MIAKTAALVALSALALSLPALTGEQYDPRIAQAIEATSRQFPAPDFCKVVGGWEDGSIVAFCDMPIAGYEVPQEFFIAHGPDADDTWQHYDGPLMDRWIKRAYN